MKEEFRICLGCRSSGIGGEFGDCGWSNGHGDGMGYSYFISGIFYEAGYGYDYGEENGEGSGDGYSHGFTIVKRMPSSGPSFSHSFDPTLESFTFEAESKYGSGLINQNHFGWGDEYGFGDGETGSGSENGIEIKKSYEYFKYNSFYYGNGDNDHQFDWYSKKD
jgi:hypothetical protein